MVLAAGSSPKINTGNSKPVFDHGSEFRAHIIHDDGSWNGGFNDHLKRYDIKPISARVMHPRTNGKLERFSGSLRES
jgi:transposase InsO family protein